MSFREETGSSRSIRSSVKDRAAELQRMETENPEEYARVIEQGRATSEKYRRMARGGK